MKRTISLLMALVMAMTLLVGTASAEAAELTYAEGLHDELCRLYDEA